MDIFWTNFWQNCMLCTIRRFFLGIFLNKYLDIFFELIQGQLLISINDFKRNFLWFSPRFLLNVFQKILFKFPGVFLGIFQKILQEFCTGFSGIYPGFLPKIYPKALKTKKNHRNSVRSFLKILSRIPQRFHQ